MLSVLYFFEGTAIDLDNVPKPISDALKGLVFIDDGQVTDLVCRKRDLGADLRVMNSSPVLAEGLMQGTEFLYIVVSAAPDPEVVA
jgi:hypothetical protein